MRNFLYALLTVAIVIAALLVVLNWNSITAWWNRPKDQPDNTNGEPKMSCQQQYDDAKDEYAKSGKSCIQTAVNVVCPSDSTFIVSVNPCVEKLLKKKGWKSSDQNNGNTPSVQYDLQVSNPNGAFMYYQLLSSPSGEMVYNKSNILVPYGSKLKLIKTWQTTDSTQKFGGYYETDYKGYGYNSGFFDIKDLKKI